MTSDKLLLLSCCAPCSVGVIRYLYDNKTDFTVLFYNPNIRPQEEYIRRRDENKRICQELKIPFMELPYQPDLWIKETQWPMFAYRFLPIFSALLLRVYTEN